MKVELSDVQCRLIVDALDARIAAVSRMWAKETVPEIRKYRVEEMGRLRDLRGLISGLNPVT